MASKKPTTVWNDVAHVSLLLSMAEHAPPNPAQWQNIINHMGTKGYDFSASAAV